MGAKPCAFILNLQNTSVRVLADLVRKAISLDELALYFAWFQIMTSLKSLSEVLTEDKSHARPVKRATSS